MLVRPATCGDGFHCHQPCHHQVSVRVPATPLPKHLGKQQLVASLLRNWDGVPGPQLQLLLPLRTRLGHSWGDSVDGQNVSFSPSMIRINLIFVNTSRCKSWCFKYLFLYCFLCFYSFYFLKHLKKIVLLSKAGLPRTSSTIALQVRYTLTNCIYKFNYQNFRSSGRRKAADTAV